MKTRSLDAATNRKAAAADVLYQRDQAQIDSRAFTGLDTVDDAVDAAMAVKNSAKALTPSPSISESSMSETGE